MIIRIFIALIFPVSLFAQNELTGYYNSCGSGRSLNINYIHKLNENSNIGGGLLVNLKRNGMHDNNNNVYYKRLHPEKFHEYFGVNFFYERRILSGKSPLPLFFITDVQLKYSRTKDRAFVPYVDWEINPLGLLVESKASFGPFLWNQYSFGLGFDIPLVDKLSITQKLGGGVEFIFGRDPFLFGGSHPAWEFAYLYNIGIKYQLNK